MDELSFQTEFENYWDSLIQVIPAHMFQVLFGILCMGVVLLITWKGVEKGFQYTSRLMLAEFCFIIYCSTVIYRNAGDFFKYDFHPLWSYAAILDGKIGLLAQNIMNIIVFLPVGLLIGMGFPRWSWGKAIGLGCIISISIEVMQYILKRGFSEMDDVIHNTLGCVIGYGVVKSIMYAHSVIVEQKR